MAGKVFYEYDALGRRVKRTKGDSITEISYDGLDVVFEADEDYHFIKYANAPGIDNKLRQTTDKLFAIHSSFFTIYYLPNSIYQLY